MLTRQVDISKTTLAPGTYQWMFTGESPYQIYPRKYEKFLAGDPERRAKPLAEDLERCKRFLQWLTNEQPLFWINGKMGSGKSSLMLFIANHEKTLQGLRSWAGQRPVHIIKFFFWRLGSVQQRSVTGLLQSLTHQLLSINPAMIDDLLAAKHIQRHPTWELGELEKVLNALLIHWNREHICLFIDGLDEYDGDYESLLDIILAIKSYSNVKICLSSRPEDTIQTRLGDCPSISMQNLNRGDIELLVEEKLKPCLHDPSDRIIQKVTNRAEGVILWASLVCESLKKGYKRFDDAKILEKRLNDFHPGLKAFFQHTFSKIDVYDQEDLKFYCHLLEWNSKETTTFSTSIDLIAASLRDAEVESLGQFLELCTKCEKRIAILSQGLIQIAERDAPETHVDGWSLQELANSNVGQAHPDLETQRKVLKYSHTQIRWVHRSARDCVFGELGKAFAPWVSVGDENELKSKAALGWEWLGLKALTVQVRHHRKGPVYTMDSRLSNVTRDLTRLLAHDHEEARRIFHRLQTLLVSSLTGSKRSDHHKRLQNMGFGDPGYPVEILPSVEFWRGILKSGQANLYLDLLVDHPMGAVICRRIVSEKATANRFDESMDLALFQCAFEYVRRQNSQTTISKDSWNDRQFSCTRTHIRSPGNSIVLSWLGTGDRDDSYVMKVLASFQDGRWLPSQHGSEILDLFEARDTWQGLQAQKGSQLLPLQLLLPNRAFVQWESASRKRASSLSPDGISSSLFRLVFLDRHSCESPDWMRRQQIEISCPNPEVFATFVLSATTTRHLLEHPVLSVRQHPGGTMGDHSMLWDREDSRDSVCQEAVLEDLQANLHKHLAPQQQQQYVIDCVKRGFQCMMWRHDKDDAPWCDLSMDNARNRWP